MREVRSSLGNIGVGLALLVSLLTGGCQGYEDMKAKYGKLSVEGTYLLGEDGKPVVLRGVSFFWHPWQPRFYEKETVAWLKDDWGASVVRAAVGLNEYPSKGSYLEDPEKAIELAEKVIEGAIESGIYVIIDWHSHTLLTDEAKAFFVKMAERYGEYPNVIYEIYNEPIDDSWSDVKAYSEEVIRAIRAVDPDNLILVGSPHWDQDVHLVADDPLQGFENIMYTLHYYAATHHNFLLDRANYALGKGLPLFVSESAGMKADGDSAIDYEWWQRWIDWSEANKVSYLTWAISDKDETSSMLLPSAQSKGGWLPADLKESGKAFRKMLRQRAGLDDS